MQPPFSPQKCFTQHAGPTDTLALFIHGITEGTEQFREMATWANQLHADAIALVLPGHGGSAEDFAHSGKQLWREYVNNEMKKYRMKYKRIILVGHSMGGLLAILTYMHNQQAIVGIISIGCPLHVWVTPRAVRNLLSLRYCPSSTNPDVKELRKYINVAPGNTFDYIHWLPRLRDLFNLMDEVRQSLPYIHIPILAVQGMRDELVDPQRSVQCYQQKTNKKFLQLLILNESTHFYYPTPDWTKLQNAFHSFYQTTIQQTENS